MVSNVNKGVDKGWKCIHERGRIYWDSYHREFRCHRCAEKFIPQSKIPKFILRLNKIFKWF